MSDIDFDYGPIMERTAALLREEYDGQLVSTLRAIEARDLPAALSAWGIHHAVHHAFVWPETYAKTYWYQRPFKEIPEFPVVLRSAKTSLRAKYTGRVLLIRVFERFARFHSTTAVDVPASKLFDSIERRFAAKYGEVRNSEPLAQYRGALRRAVLVRGKIIPMDPERIAVLEKNIRIVEKIEALAA